jgi:hypothetical protein
MNIVFTKHVIERGLCRGINCETIVEILKNPDNLSDSFDGRKIASKKLDFLWNVIFVEENGKKIVITAYHE